jgi:hypothetical protein
MECKKVNPQMHCFDFLLYSLSIPNTIYFYLFSGQQELMKQTAREIVVCSSQFNREKRKEAVCRVTLQYLLETLKYGN